MKVKALVVSCTINKTSVESLLSQLGGVKRVFVGGNRIAIEYEEGKEGSLLKALESIKGVTNPTQEEIEVSSIPVVKIPGDREGYFANGVKLPKALEPTLNEEGGSCNEDFCEVETILSNTALSNTTLSSTSVNSMFDPVDEDLIQYQ